MDLFVDTESQGFTMHFILGVINPQKGSPKVYHNAVDLWNAIVETGKKEFKAKRHTYVYVHNLLFDWYRIRPIDDRNIKRVCLSPARFEYGEWNNNTYTPFIHFIDTMGIFPMSLASIGDIYGRKKDDIHDGIGRKLFQNEKQFYDFGEINQIREYCIGDTEVLKNAIGKLKRELREEGIKVRRIITAPQIAMSGFFERARYDEEISEKCLDTRDFRQSWKQTEYRFEVGKAYRGGRTQAFDYGDFPIAYQYDMNSMYPYATKFFAFPDLSDEKKSREIDYSRIGVAKVTIKGRDIQRGVLPIRVAYSDESGYIQEFPEGNFTLNGTWTLKELEFAEKRGYTIQKVEHVISYGETNSHLLWEYMHALYEKKKRTGNYLYKLLMNSLIGKFGQIREEEEEAITERNKTSEMIQKGYEEKAMIGPEIVWGKKTGKVVDKYYVPIICSTVNAIGRILLFEACEKAGWKNVKYVSTDSILTTSPILETELGDKIGQWRMINQGEAYIFGKGAYRVGTNIRINGVSKRDQTMEAFKKGKISYQRMISERENKRLAGSFTTLEIDLEKRREKEEERKEKLAGICKNGILYDYLELK